MNPNGRDRRPHAEGWPNLTNELIRMKLQTARETGVQDDRLLDWLESPTDRIADAVGFLWAGQPAAVPSQAARLPLCARDNQANDRQDHQYCYCRGQRSALRNPYERKNTNVSGSSGLRARRGHSSSNGGGRHQRSVVRSRQYWLVAPESNRRVSFARQQRWIVITDWH